MKEEVHMRRKGHGLDKEAQDRLAGLTGPEPNRADVPAGEAGDQQEQPHQPVSLPHDHRNMEHVALKFLQEQDERKLVQVT